MFWCDRIKIPFKLPFGRSNRSGPEPRKAIAIEKRLYKKAPFTDWRFSDSNNLDDMKEDIKLSISHLSEYLNSNKTLLDSKTKDRIKITIKNLKEKKIEIKKIIEINRKNSSSFWDSLGRTYDPRHAKKIDEKQNGINEKKFQNEAIASQLYIQCKLEFEKEKSFANTQIESQMVSCSSQPVLSAVVFSKKSSSSPRGRLDSSNSGSNPETQHPLVTLIRTEIDNGFVDSELFGKWQWLANKISDQSLSMFTINEVRGVFLEISPRFNSNDPVIDQEFQKTMLEKTITYLEDNNRTIGWLSEQYNKLYIKHKSKIASMLPLHDYSRTSSRFGSFSPSSYRSATPRCESSPVNQPHSEDSTELEKQKVQVLNLKQWVDQEKEELCKPLIEDSQGLKPLFNILQSIVSDLNKLNKITNVSQKRTLLNNLYKKQGLYLDIEKNNKWLNSQFDEVKKYPKEFVSKYSMGIKLLHSMEDSLNKYDLESFERFKIAFNNDLELSRKRIFKESLLIENKYERDRAQRFLRKMEEEKLVTLTRLLSVGDEVENILRSEKSEKIEVIQKSNKAIREINDVLKLIGRSKSLLPKLESSEIKKKLSALQANYNNLNNYKSKLMPEWFETMRISFDIKLSVDMLKAVPELRSLDSQFTLTSYGYVIGEDKTSRFVNSNDVLNECLKVFSESNPIIVALKQRQAILDKINELDLAKESGLRAFEDQLKSLIDVQEGLIHRIFFATKPRFEFRVTEGLPLEARCFKWLKHLQSQQITLRWIIKNRTVLRSNSENSTRRFGSFATSQAKLSNTATK